MALLHGRVGEQCKADKAILDKICVFAFSSESVEQLKNDVDEAYSKLQIIDDMGNDMIYDRLVTSEILKWGDGTLRLKKNYSEEKALAETAALFVLPCLSVKKYTKLLKRSIQNAGMDVQPVTGVFRILYI